MIMQIMRKDIKFDAQITIVKYLFFIYEISTLIRMLSGEITHLLSCELLNEKQ